METVPSWEMQCRTSALQTFGTSIWMHILVIASVNSMNESLPSPLLSSSTRHALNSDPYLFASNFLNSATRTSSLVDPRDMAFVEEAEADPGGLALGIIVNPI